MQISQLSKRLAYVSAGYADYYKVDRTPEWSLLKLTEELGELTQAHLTLSGQGRDRGQSTHEQRQNVAAEVADVVAMALVYAEQAGVDVEDAITSKWLAYETFHRERGFTQPQESR